MVADIRITKGFIVHIIVYKRKKILNKQLGSLVSPYLCYPDKGGPCTVIENIKQVEQTVLFNATGDKKCLFCVIFISKNAATYYILTDQVKKEELYQALTRTWLRKKERKKEKGKKERMNERTKERKKERKREKKKEKKKKERKNKKERKTNKQTKKKETKKQKETRNKENKRKKERKKEYTHPSCLSRHNVK